MSKKHTPTPAAAPISDETITAMIDAQMQEILLLREEIAALKAAAESAPTSSLSVSRGEERGPQMPRPTCLISGKEYRFRYAKFLHEGIVILAEEAIKSPDLLSRLIEEAPGVFEAI